MGASHFSYWINDAVKKNEMVKTYYHNSSSIN